MTKKALALFDFDGTVSYKDSFFEFFKSNLSTYELIKGLLILSPTILGYKFGIIPNYKAKKNIFGHFYKSYDYQKFVGLSNDFSDNIIPKIVRKSAIERINWHKNQGHTVVIVSATFEEWLQNWCNKLGIDLIGTKMEVLDDRITGNFLTPNCFGPEKVNRVKEKYNLEDFEYIYAYGDSKGDMEMLEIANEKYYQHFV